MTGYANDKPVSNREPHHYVFHIEYCPVCGSERTDKTRVAGPRPTSDNLALDYYSTHFIEDRHDYCEG